MTPGQNTEKCDGVDNDCNGTVDDNAPCPIGQLCTRGRCADPCGSEALCPLGQSCELGRCVTPPALARAAPLARCLSRRLVYQSVRGHCCPGFHGVLGRHLHRLVCGGGLSVGEGLPKRRLRDHLRLRSVQRRPGLSDGNGGVCLVGLPEHDLRRRRLPGRLVRRPPARAPSVRVARFARWDVLETCLQTAVAR